MARFTGGSRNDGEIELGGGGSAHGRLMNTGYTPSALTAADLNRRVSEYDFSPNRWIKGLNQALMVYGAGQGAGLWGPDAGAGVAGGAGASGGNALPGSLQNMNNMNALSSATVGGGSTVASGIPWMDIIKGGASLLGGKMQSDAAKDAAKRAAAGSQAEMDLIDKWMNIARNDTQQTRQAGSTALNAMMSMTGLAPGGQVQYDQSGWPMPVGTPQQALSVPEPPMGRAMGGGMAAGGSYNINEMGPENVYSGGDVTRWGGPQTVQPSQGGYVQPNSTPPTAGGANDQPGGIDTTQGTGYDWRTDPGYQFRFEEGQRALDRGAAARGGLLSGGYARKTQRYGQDFASNEYTNVYNRISNIAGMGQVANQHAGNYALQGGFGMGAAAGAKGVNSAYGAIGSGNAWANSMNDISNLPWDTYWGNS